MKPYIIKVPESSGKGGKLSFIEDKILPFVVQRLYWTYGLEKSVIRGGHSHQNSDRIIICMNGRVEVALEDKSGKKSYFELNDPSEVLYFPRQHWITMNCSANTILLALASCRYEDDIYQKDYAHFKGEK